MILVLRIGIRSLIDSNRCATQKSLQGMRENKADSVSFWKNPPAKIVR